jgi:outer membrane protein W
MGIEGRADYSGADYEVDRDGVIHSRTLDIEGKFRRERVVRRKTLAERMADKRRRIEKRNNSRLVQKLELIRIKQEKKLSRKLGKAFKKVNRPKQRPPLYGPESRNLDFVPNLPQAPLAPAPVVSVDIHQPVLTSELPVEKKEKNLKIIPYGGFSNLSSASFRYKSNLFPGLAVENKLSENFSVGLDFNYNTMEIENYVDYYGSSSRMDYKQLSVELYSKFYFSGKGRFLPYLGAGIGYKNINIAYSPSNSAFNWNNGYNGNNTNDNGLKGRSVFASASVGTEFYFNSQFGLNAQFKYSKGLSSTIDNPVSSYNYINGYPLSNNESELSQMAKEVASVGQQSLYVGAIVKF